MQWTPLRVAPTALAMLLLSAGCGEGIAGPRDNVLLGQFGAADLTVELLATHAGVELAHACGDYFASTRAAALDADGDFRVRGEWHRALEGVGSAEGATLSGRARIEGGIETVTVSVVVDGPGESADLLVLTLRRAEHYAGPPLPCPL